MTTLRNFSPASILIYMLAVLLFGIGLGLLAYEHLLNVLGFAIWGFLMLGLFCLTCSLVLDKEQPDAATDSKYQ